jgi:tRNA A-37 threonylcarbamoyl transferase component Bud32
VNAGKGDRTATDSEFRDPLIGRVLSDRYRVLGLLGRGGMGVVYRAEHVLIQRTVAIKMLHPQLTASAELVQRFHREARAAALTGNEHVVDVTDMGRLDDGSYFIVLEYLDGLDLAQLVAEVGPLPIARALAIAIQICVALEAVHGAGIVHRDLKPENIFLVRRGAERDFVKVLDFGICKFLKDRPLTVTGVAMGTPRFMSPEQLEARPEIDQRADVYGVGAILFFALTGQGPFDRESLPRLLVSIWSEPAPRLRQVCPHAPEALEALVARALEKSPDRRFASTAELRGALEEVLLASEGLPAPHWASASGIREAAVPLPTIPGLRRSRRALLASVALILLLCGVLLGWRFWPAVPPRPRVPHAQPASAAPAAPIQRAVPATQADEPLPQAATPHPVLLKRKPQARHAQVESPPAAPQQPTAAEPISEPSPPPPPRAPEPASPPAAAPLLVPSPQQLKPVF